MVSRFVLPKTVQARNWVRSTDALRGHLLDRLSTVRDRANAKRREADEIEAEAAQLEQAIALLDQILPRRSTASALSAPAAGGRAALPPDSSSAAPDATPKRFSLMYDKCKKCGRGPAEGVRHAARGLCQACYWNEHHGKSGDDLDEAVREAANGLASSDS